MKETEIINCSPLLFFIGFYITDFKLHVKIWKYFETRLEGVLHYLEKKFVIYNYCYNDNYCHL